MVSSRIMRSFCSWGKEGVESEKKTKGQRKIGKNEGTDLLIGMDGLGMLAEVIEAGELLPAVTGKGALSSVFSVGGSQ